MASQEDVSALRILVAEDSPDDAMFLERAFQKVGAEKPVAFCRDGEQTIHYLQGLPPYDNRAAFPLPSLLLLDLKMPKVSGLEVLEWLKKNGKLGDIRAAVLSSSDFPSDIKRAHELGAWFYLVKPNDYCELVEMVRRLVSCWNMPERPGGVWQSSVFVPHSSSSF
jgi:CheY-like chemotaxis protein